MTLGAALLHSQAVLRPPPDAEAALLQDVLRLMATVVEDAAAQGPMAGAVEQAVAALGDAVRVQVEPRLATVQQKLRARLNGPRSWLDARAAEFEAAAQDPAAIVALLRSMLTELKELAGSLTLNRIRQESQFLVDIFETDLGISPAFLASLGLGLLDDIRGRWLAVDAGSDLALRRRLRAGAAIVSRIRLRLAGYEPPRLEVEPLARAIHRWLQETGVNGVLAEVGCALDAIDTAAATAQAGGEAALSGPPQPIGAGIVPLENASEYAWYASWLLNDEDFPLLGISDIARPREFVLRFKSPARDTERVLRDRFGGPVRAAIDAYEESSGDPSREVMLTLLAAINVEMQRGSIFDGEAIEDVTLTEDLEELSRDFREDQSLFLYNRRFLEHALAPDIETLSGGVARWLGRFFLGQLVWPRNQVFVTGDRRFVMCDDKPMIMGEDLKWTDAPIFEAGSQGQMWFNFEHISPRVCEGFAQHLSWLAEAGKAVAHLIELQPGHRVGSGIVGGVEITDAVQRLLFGKPLSGYFLEQSKAVRDLGKWLDSGLGLKGLATFGASFQGPHTAAPAGNGFLFWLTVMAGDLVRVAGRSLLVNTIRDVILSFITLLNFRGPRDAPSTLPSQPARNHVKQDPITSLSDSLFLMLLASLHERDDYSIEIWSAPNIGDQRARAMAGHWFGGSVGMGLASGLAGSLFAQITAWAEDWALLGKTIGISMLKMFLLFWFMVYLTKENDTDEGRYRAGGGRFAGYPARGSSPYRLPYAGGDALYVGQANLGLFSHNFISNIASGRQQTYAYDFGHDFRETITAVRGGTIVSFIENNPDSGNQQNEIVIRHDTIDADHDDFGTGPVQTYSVYIHLATNGVTGAFGGTAPAIGTAVTRGQAIALAGDTGRSFHNHLHLHVCPDDGTGTAPNRTVSIPFVFGDAPGDGVLDSLTWYESGNA